jgi:hypothetical protein
MEAAMMSKTSFVHVAVHSAVAPTPASPAAAAASSSAATPANPLAYSAAVEAGPGRPLFAPRPRRLGTGPAPAALIVLVWMLLWAWVSLGVAAPLSRLGGPERARAVQESALRA